MADVYRQIYTSFWQDNFVISLTPEEKYFYLYLITNSKTTLCGIYELPIQVAVFETGYNRETIEKLIAKFEEYNKIHYSLTTYEIVIHNFLKYNLNRSPKVQSAVNKGFEAVKDKSLIPYAYGMDTVSSVTGTVTGTVSVTETVIPQSDNADMLSAPPKKKSKHKYGEYQRVLLTDDEHSKLVKDYKNADELIKFLDEYIEMKGYKAKSHYLAIKKWVVNAVDEDNKKSGKILKSSNPSYDLQEFEDFTLNYIPKVGGQEK